MIDHSVHTKQITVQQNLDVRRTIELRTVALAALRRTEDEAAEIVEIASGMRRSSAQPAKVMELDIAFHETIARASRNPLFSLLVGSFRVVTRETWGIGWASRPTDEARMESVEGHGAIAAAILDRNPQTAEKAMADHFDLTSRPCSTPGQLARRRRRNRKAKRGSGPAMKIVSIETLRTASSPTSSGSASTPMPA